MKIDDIVKINDKDKNIKKHLRGKEVKIKLIDDYCVEFELDEIRYRIPKEDVQ